MQLIVRMHKKWPIQKLSGVEWSVSFPVLLLQMIEQVLYLFVRIEQNEIIKKFFCWAHEIDYRYLYRKGYHIVVNAQASKVLGLLRG